MDDFPLTSAPATMLSHVQLEFEAFSKLHQLTDPTKRRKYQKKMLKTHGKLLLKLLDSVLPVNKTTSASDGCHLPTAAYIATQLFALNGVLPQKHMLLVSEHLSRGCSILPFLSRNVVEKESGKGQKGKGKAKGKEHMENESFRLRCRVQQLSLQFAEATCTDQRLVQSVVLSKVWNFYRNVCRGSLKLNNKIEVSKVQKVLVEHCTKMIKYAMSLGMASRTTIQGQENATKNKDVEESRKGGSDDKKKKANKQQEFEPRQYTLLLLVDHMTTRGGGTKYLPLKSIESLLKICTNHARRSALSADNKKKTKKNKVKKTTKKKKKDDEDDDDEEEEEEEEEEEDVVIARNA